MTHYYRVAVNTPFNKSVLTYRSEKHFERGSLVMAPLGKRVVIGCVLSNKEDPSQIENIEKLKELEVSEYEFSFSESELRFLEWTASYYHYPIGQMISDILPSLMKKPRVLNAILPNEDVVEIPLNEEQRQCVSLVLKDLHHYKRWLLHGVTGSGKSNVYLTLISKVISEKKSALFLLPEINLTPQFIEMFQQKIKAPLYIYNSSISKSDKLGLWNRVTNSSEPFVVIGVRSAIFLPITDLGIIIVDEEHDSSFKQEDRCAYNARDLAIKKAAEANIPVMLGSATPSMESYVEAQNTERYLTLKKMALSSARPEIELVDLRTENKSKLESEVWPFRKETLESIREALVREEQVLVFLNKLGFADYLQCRSCGHDFHCPNCSSNLKFFKRKNSTECQICGYSASAPQICPKCSNMQIKQIGYGTEKIAEVLKEFFPNKKIERFDRDELTTSNKVHERLEQFHAGEIDIFVGTQMLAKGHNFRRVNLVVVMGIDAQLNFPDFRATERAYQLLTQVSGRPGRFGSNSKVIVQTLNTDNPLFEIVKDHKFREFYEKEIPFRKKCQTPPFARIAMIYLTSKSQSLVADWANGVASMLQNISKSHLPTIQVLGPRPALIEKRVNKYTWSLMLRSSDRSDLHKALNTLENNIGLPKEVALKYDVDPYHLH
jgi:primosomal protein N' (replication factor Y) (superfamily II helicase)